MNNADLIIATLKANGVTRGFGIPSGNVLPLMEAMRTGGVEFVLTAHEGSAGFAADVTGRMTGAPGLCIATLGPGATNLATGVGGAFLDRSPLIAITCNLNTDQLGRRIQMWIDHHALFKPITKATLKLEPGCVAETVTQAIALALSEPKGPVHLDLRRPLARAHQGKTDSASVPALRHRAAGGSLPRTAGALFRRARGRRQHSRRARGCGQDGAGGKRTDGDRGRGRFRALHRHGLRLSLARCGHRWQRLL
jgi:acetolactate synthase-1/2/3 large subunit